MSLGTTAVATVALAAINPFLPLALLYDYYLLLGFTQVLNQTTFVITMDESKRNVFLNKLNFLGYETAPKKNRVNLRKITYMGPYTNKFITLDHKGLLPSISRLMNFGGKKKNKDEDINAKFAKRDQV